MKNHVFPVRLGVLSAALVAAFPILSFSQTGVTPQLGETVVAATRSPQPLEAVVADISIIDREQIERSGAVGLADVLKRVPGIEISRNGGPVSTTGVFLRGAESRFTAVYIDGVRIDSQATGGAAWENIPLALVDRIEVLRGPAGAVYGSDALGGVIQIFTKRGEDGFAPYVGIGVGTYNTRKVEGGFSGASGGFDYALGLVHEKSDGFNATTVATQNPDKDGYRSQSANLRLGFQVNRAHRLEATYLTTDSNAGYDNGLGTDDRSLRKLDVMGLNWQAKWSDVWSTRLSVTDSRDRYELPSIYLTTTNLRGYTLQNEFRLGQHLLTAAVERKEDHLQNAPIDQGRSQDALALGYSFADKSHSLQLNLRHDKDSEFGGKNTGSAAYAYTFAPEWRVSASIGTAFRAPTLYQRFSSSGVPTLGPESSKNIELGLRWSSKASSVGLVVYQNKVDNLINYVTGAGACASPFGCYANVLRAEYSGATLTGSHRVGGVNLGASLDLQNPRDLTTGKQLARRSKQHGTLTADYRFGTWLLGAEAQFSGQRFNDANNLQPLAGYSLFNLSASTPFAKDWTLLARVDNLSDKKYELARTYATAGRSVYVGVKWAPK